jgi:hypothetical protein
MQIDDVTRRKRDAGADRRDAVLDQAAHLGLDQRQP